MVPYRHTADLVLLPYEKHLIDALGCTEEEYKQFVRHLQHKATARPAEYELVPDVKNDATVIAIVVSLAVGLITSAVSYLLMPKPKAQRDITQLQLGGADGASKFSPNSGFDSAQNLASYGISVPIVFTKRIQIAGETSGGLLISPALVWSRMKSWGSFQVVEIVTVAGQGVMDRPDRSGLFLGNNAIDGIFESDFQFYWNNGSSVASRLLGLNLRYGTLSTPNIPSPQENAFVAPTKQGVNDTGFCGAFTPTNQTKFGVYQGIPNGTPYRPNWEISQPLASQTIQAKEQVITNQRKFVDQVVQVTAELGGGRQGQPELAGMPGTGVNYARHVGVISHNGYQVPNPGLQSISGYPRYVGNLTEERTVVPGDIIEVVIGYGRQNREPFGPFGGKSTKVNVDDVRSATDAEAEQFDAAMVKGQTYMIGRTTWQIIDRDNRIYTPGGAPIVIKMQCLETWSANQAKIGLVAPSILGETGAVWGRDILEVFYPILRVDFAHVRNNRPCDVTEIGIRSQAWTKFNGITNFNTLPTPFQLNQNNNNNIQVREGTSTSYVRRTSFFALDVRPADNELSRTITNNDGFTFLGLFAVSGSTPQDIYSFIRITHPSNALFEYRLRPFNSAILAIQSGGGDDIFELNGSGTPYQERTATTYMGTFAFGGRGKYIKAKDVFTHSQMAVRPEQIGELQYGQWSTLVSGVEFLGAFSTSNGEAAAWNTLSNILALARGLDPYFDNLPVGYTTTIENWTYNRDAPKIAVMRIRLRAYERTLPTTPRNKWWEIIGTEVTFTGNWQPNEQFIKNASTVAGVQYGFRYRVTTRSEYQEYDAPQSTTRIFEVYSGIAEVSHYGDLITRSCDNGPEHEIVYVNESIAEDTTIGYKGLVMAGLKLRSSNSLQTLDQLRCYMKEGVQVELLSDGGVGPSNLFTDLVWYLATNKDIGLGSVISPELLDRTQLAATGHYLRANRLLFDDVIADSLNFRSFISEKAPSLLCYAAIRNGKLSIDPALPVGSDLKVGAVKPPIAAMFTDGNIIQGSFNLDWLELEERKMFQAAVIFTRSPVNQLSRQETVVVQYNEAGAADLPIEEFNLPHVSSAHHAAMAAKYFLALRKYITHTITFQTLPYGLALAPGQFIMVAVEMSPYSPSNNGIVQPDGTVISIQPLTDGNYSVNAWERETTEVRAATLTIAGGIATNLRNSVFSVINSNVTQQVYQVDALDVDENGIVTIRATNFPVDSNGATVIGKDIADANAFTIVGEGAPT
tara:strand:- start:40 stop:3798 length:3759 start_codon:yes stop_codon:yes gene_type:complete